MAVIACCLTMASAANAQTLTNPERRPGLFGRAPSRDEILDVSVATSSVYDDNLIAEQRSGLTDPRTQVSGPYDSLSASVTYAKKAHAVAVTVSESSALRYYPTLADLLSARHSLAAGVSAESARTKFGVSQTLEYAPFYTFTTIPQPIDAQPAEGLLPTSDDFIVRNEARILGSAVRLTRLIGGRTSLLFSASTSNTEFLRDGSGLRTSGASGRMVYHVSRDLGLVAGYGYQEGNYRLNPSTSETTPLHNIDVGVDYNHALSRSRRTTIGFMTGATVVKGTGVEDHRMTGDANYVMTGDVHVSREIGRTWHATAAFHRGVGLVEGFREPLLADSLAFDAGGALNSRVTLSMAAGYSNGQLGVTSDAVATRNYNGSAHLRVALSRLLAISAEYSLYNYAFDQGAVLPLGMPPSLDRRSFRVGLDLWLPLIR